MFHIRSIAKIPLAMILAHWPEGHCLPLVSLFGFSGAFTWIWTPSTKSSLGLMTTFVLMEALRSQPTV